MPPDLTTVDCTLLVLMGANKRCGVFSLKLNAGSNIRSAMPWGSRLFGCFLLVCSLALVNCQSGPPTLPEDSGTGPCEYKLSVDGQIRFLRGACPPIEIVDLWKTLPDWFQNRFQLVSDEVLRQRLRLYSGPHNPRALIVDGKRYDLIPPDLLLKGETSLSIE
jgi:hypothetical protein